MTFTPVAPALLIALLVSPAITEQQSSERSRTQGLKETDRFAKAGTTTSRALTDAKMQVQKTLDAYNALWADSVFQFPFNFSGLPAISLPLGQSKENIPIGVQLVGRYGDEVTVLAVSTVLEQAMPWKNRRPPVSA